MKRIHLFEFEDKSWFPSWARVCITRFIVVMHKLLKSDQELAKLIARAIKHTTQPEIVDLCSGSGGPMLEVAKILRNQDKLKDLKLTLTDLYPNKDTAARINQNRDSSLVYLATPVDAANLDRSKKGVRTMVGSFHHMKPEIAKSILKNAKEARQPICIYEISDNSFPIWLWWIAIFPTFLMTFFLTPFIRPLTWNQIIFTYLIPVLPIFVAWDGAVSNARTYTIDDLNELTKDLESDSYKWEKGIIKGKLSGKIYLLGLPVQ